MKTTDRALFIDSTAGDIFLSVYQPDGTATSAVLVLPAFAEEMNKSRRLIWHTGNSLASKGILVLVPDLFGTGDSAGGFENSTWKIWLADLQATMDWARREYGPLRFDALAVRMGAAFLSAPIFAGQDKFSRVVAWEPVKNGRDALRQMLRMQIMSDRMMGRKANSIDRLQSELAERDSPMPLAGYPMSGRMAKDISAARFDPSVCQFKENGLIIKISGSNNETRKEVVEHDGWNIRIIKGQRFWSAVEPDSNPELVRQTVQFLTQ